MVCTHVWPKCMMMYGIEWYNFHGTMYYRSGMYGTAHTHVWYV